MHGLRFKPPRGSIHATYKLLLTVMKTFQYKVYATRDQGPEEAEIVFRDILQSNKNLTLKRIGQLTHAGQAYFKQVRKEAFGKYPLENSQDTSASWTVARIKSNKPVTPAVPALNAKMRAARKALYTYIHKNRSQTITGPSGEREMSRGSIRGDRLHELEQALVEAQKPLIIQTPAGPRLKGESGRNARLHRGAKPNPSYAVFRPHEAGEEEPTEAEWDEEEYYSDGDSHMSYDEEDWAAREEAKFEQLAEELGYGDRASDEGDELLPDEYEGIGGWQMDPADLYAPDGRPYTEAEIYENLRARGGPSGYGDFDNVTPYTPPPWSRDEALHFDETSPPGHWSYADDEWFPVDIGFSPWCGYAIVDFLVGDTPHPPRYRQFLANRFFHTRLGGRLLYRVDHGGGARSYHDTGSFLLVAAYGRDRGVDLSCFTHVDETDPMSAYSPIVLTAAMLDGLPGDTGRAERRAHIRCFDNHYTLLVHMQGPTTRMGRRDPTWAHVVEVEPLSMDDPWEFITQESAHDALNRVYEPHVAHTRPATHAPMVTPSLNGSHGEFTEGDDMAGAVTKQEQRDALERARREAKNRQQKKKKDERREGSVSDKKPAAAPLPIAPGIGGPVPPPEAAVEPAPATTVHYVVIRPGDNFGYSGKGFVTRVAGAWVDADGNVYPEAPGEVAHPRVLNSGPGWFTQSSNPAKGAIVVSRYCVDVMEVPRFQMIGCQPRYTYFIPLMTDLRLTFPGVMEKRVCIASRAKASKHFDNSAPQWLVDSTVDAFLCGKAHSTLGLDTDEAARITNMRYSSGGVVYDEEISAYAAAGVSQVRESSWTSPGITCGDIPYRMKTTFNLTTSGNVRYTPVLIGQRVIPKVDGAPVFANLRGGAELEDRYRRGELEVVHGDDHMFIPEQTSSASILPAFTANLGGGRLPKFKITNYFRLLGDREFVIYDVNAQNASVALKRIVGARDAENFYYKQQFSLLAVILDLNPAELPGYTSVLDTLRTQHNANNKQFVIGRVGGRDDGFGIPTWHSVPTRYREVDRDSARALFVSIETPFEDADAYAAALHWVGTKAADLVANSTYDGLFERIFTKNLDKINTIMHHWSYYSGYEQLLVFLEPFLSREFNASIPHVKKKLREAYVKGVLLHDNADIMVKRLNACVKKEFAKGGGKAPRLFVSYEAGCMYANELPEWTKVLLDNSPNADDPHAFESFAKTTLPTTHSFRHNCMSCNIYIMAKMHTGSMDAAFNHLIEAMGVVDHMHVLIYSDDSVYVGNIDGKRFAFNVDISSCDSSQGPLVFGLTGKILHQLQPERGLGLLKQCMLPITLRNPDDHDSSITVRCHGPFEGSGTVLTTILNHVASYLIASSALYIVAENYGLLANATDKLDMLVGSCIEAGAALAGHKVTVESCRVGGEVVVERIQFLKRSPMQLTTGEWVAAVNYGCILRGFGTCEGDMLPAQLGLTPEQFVRLHEREKMEMFSRGVVAGLVHEPSSAIMAALRGLFHTQTNFLAKEFQPDSPVSVSTVHHGGAELRPESVCRRYGLTENEVKELAAGIGGIGLGRVLKCAALTKIYKTDYGL